MTTQTQTQTASRCIACDGRTTRETMVAHDYGSTLYDRRFGASWCEDCLTSVSRVPMHRGCENGGATRPRGWTRCVGCGRLLDGEAQDRIRETFGMAAAAAEAQAGVEVRS